VRINGMEISSLSSEEVEELTFRNSREWGCPRCGEPVALYGRGSLPEDMRCERCKGLEAERVQPPRAEWLAAAGVPRLYASRPFLERPWPTTRGLSAGTWGGTPWAAGFVGPTGTGKTMYAIEALWRLARAKNLLFGRPPLFTRAARLLASLFGTTGEDERREAYEAATRAPVLVLDDLAWGAQGRAFETIFEIIAARYEDELPVIYTVNHASGDLYMREGGPPLIRRLREGAIFKCETLWEDPRA